MEAISKLLVGMFGDLCLNFSQFFNHFLHWFGIHFKLNNISGILWRETQEENLNGMDWFNNKLGWGASIHESKIQGGIESESERNQVGWCILAVHSDSHSSTAASQQWLTEYLHGHLVASSGCSAGETTRPSVPAAGVCVHGAGPRVFLEL